MQSLATGFTLVEGPVWEPTEGLLFSDVLNGGVYRLDRDDQVSLAVPKRRGIGGMALHADGGLVVGGKDIAHVTFDGAAPTVLLSAADVPGAIGFNDLTTDRAGRVWVGSLAYRVFGDEPRRPGWLHVIDLDGSMRTVADGVMLTNGLGFSPDGTKLYHADAGAALVRVYDVGADGTVGPWRTWVEFGADGVPDGLKVAADGSVWIADAIGGRVVVVEPDGRRRCQLDVPLPMVTSLCFGGEDLQDLYVVTGSQGGPNNACGTVFRTRTDVKGLALPAARVRPRGSR